MRTVMIIVLAIIVYAPVWAEEGDPLFRDSVMEYLPPGTIIMVGDTSVEHLYEKGEKVGPPGDEEKLDFDVEVSDWIKYRKLEEVTRGIYYDCVEAADIGPETERHHKRTYDVVFAYGMAKHYRGPWYGADNPKTKASTFRTYRYDGGVTVGVDFYDDGRRIYTDEMEYKSEENNLGRDGRAWVYSMLEGSHYGIPWGLKDLGDFHEEEWYLGWRNLEADVALRYYPNETYWSGGDLDAQYYLRFNGAVRKKNKVSWSGLPSTPGGDKILPDPAWYFKDEQWPGAAGKVWLDDAVFYEVDGGSNLPNYMDNEDYNSDFEHGGTAQWVFGAGPYVSRRLSDKAYGGSNSGLLERFDNPNPTPGNS